MENNDFWFVLATAVGLVLALEGAVYALFPQQMKKYDGANYGAACQHHSQMRACGFGDRVPYCLACAVVIFNPRIKENNQIRLKCLDFAAK